MTSARRCERSMGLGVVRVGRCRSDGLRGCQRCSKGGVDMYTISCGRKCEQPFV